MVRSEQPGTPLEKLALLGLSQSAESGLLAQVGAAAVAVYTSLKGDRR